MKSLSFKEGFRYCFNKPARMANILWYLIPIYGWFLLMGYSIRIQEEISKGKHKQLPKLIHGDDFVLGLGMFFKAIPFIIAAMIVSTIFGFLGPLSMIWTLATVFIYPVLATNFARKKTVGSYFEFNLLPAVSDNFTDYLMVVLRTIGFFVIAAVLCVVLVGIPLLCFGSNLFFADFYYRNVKK